MTYPWALTLPGSELFPGGLILPGYPIQVTPALVSLAGFDIGLDDGEVTIIFDTIDGWFGGPGSRSNFTDRVNDHGSFDAPVYRTNRVITFTGFAYSDSRAAVADTLHAMTGIMAEGQLGLVTVADPDYGSLSVLARLTDGPQIAWNASAYQWQWQMQFTAPDPHKYAEAISATTGLPTPGSGGLAFPLFDGTGKLEFGTSGDSGQVTLTNPGSADTYLTFEIAGPVLGGVSLTDVASGRSIVYAGDIPDSGVLLVIDSASGRATLNGADRTGELTTDQWWPIKKKSSSTVQFATLGASGQTGTLTASVSPAYW